MSKVPNNRAGQHDRTATPGAVTGVRVFDLPVIRDARGALSFAQVPEHLPFTALRYFLLFELHPDVARGAHAHKAHQQFFVCVHGQCRVTVNDGRASDEVVLDTPARGVYVPPMVWTTVIPGTSETVVLVLTSAPYDAADYVREYQEFEQLAAGQDR